MSSIALVILWIITRIVHSQSTLKIFADVDTVTLGGTVKITATYTDNVNTYTVWPFVNSSQWSADQPLIYPESTSKLLIPFPHIGKATVCVAILTEPYFNGIPWTVGQPLPSNKTDILALSNTLSITVTDNDQYYQNSARNKQQEADDSFVIMYWEPWHNAHNGDWTLEEAIPLVGRYDSFNHDAMKQHVLWFNDAGVDAIGIDWTNNIWNCDSWDQRGVYAQNIINSTTETLQYYHYLKTELNLKVPQFVLLLGLDNGARTSYHALDGEIQWITDNYWLNPNITDLFIMYENKPLLTIFDGGNIHGKNGTLNASVNTYTYRWMGSQFQATGLAKQGFYSWMDGTVNPVPTYVNGSATIVEALTITTAFFPASGGWFSNDAYATNNGATLLQEGISALKYKPHFLFICQWNEFRGHANGAATYGDIYNSTLGNDIEPASLTQCGYIRPNDAYCGGWGFRQLNILHSITYLLSSAAQSCKSLFLVISNPVPWKHHSKALDGNVIEVKWVELGQCNDNNQFMVMIILDTINIYNVSNMVESYQLNTADLSIGTHIIQIIASQCYSVLDLSYECLSPILSGNDMISTNDAVQFTIQS
eukprot:101371_1